MSISSLEARVADPVVEAAALQRIVQLAGAVGREHHDRTARSLDRADLGNRDLEIREELQEKGLELVVGAIDLVDKQHGVARRP